MKRVSEKGSAGAVRAGAMGRGSAPEAGAGPWPHAAGRKRAQLGGGVR